MGKGEGHVKVIKRDGREVTFDRSKIVTAIQKANSEVEPEERVDEDTIEKIVSFVESKNKKRMLVEDIQDIIELKLMEDLHHLPLQARTCQKSKYNR